MCSLISGKITCNCSKNRVHFVEKKRRGTITLTEYIPSFLSRFNIISSCCWTPISSLFSCQGKFHFINLNGNFPNKKKEERLFQKKRKTLSPKQQEIYQGNIMGQISKRVHLQQYKLSEHCNFLSIIITKVESIF